MRKLVLALALLPVFVLFACAHGIQTVPRGGECSGAGSQECMGWQRCDGARLRCVCVDNVCNGGKCDQSGECIK